MRHLTNVFEGLLKAHPKNFVHGEQLVHLWLHESERVYGDRLVSNVPVEQRLERTSSSPITGSRTWIVEDVEHIPVRNALYPVFTK